MPQNIVEKLRQESVNRLFKMTGFKKVWPKWQSIIHSKAPNPTASQILNLGDFLKDIFYSTNTHSGRSQSDVSGGGAIWEALVCWYLNICNIGRRTVCIKHHKSLIAKPIAQSITVNYGNFTSNTESDLIAITFPDEKEYSIDVGSISVKDENNHMVRLNTNKTNYLDVLNALVARDFQKIEIHIIQCKTNWNDNAQIPMLWDMIYSSLQFHSNITIGQGGYNKKDVSRFTYAFATVPTVNPDKIKQSSICVSRVRNLSGGNFWGLSSKEGIASSLKEMLNRNLSTGFKDSHLQTLAKAIPGLKDGPYSYFKF